MAVRQTITAAAAITAAALVAKLAWYGLGPTVARAHGGDLAAAREIALAALCLLVVVECAARRRAG